MSTTMLSANVALALSAFALFPGAKRMSTVLKKVLKHLTVDESILLCDVTSIDDVGLNFQEKVAQRIATTFLVAQMLHVYCFEEGGLSGKSRTYTYTKVTG